MREDRILGHLPALLPLLTGTEPAARRTDTVPAVTAEDVIGYLRGHRITLTWDPAAEALQAGTREATKTIIGKAS